MNAMTDSERRAAVIERALHEGASTVDALIRAERIERFIATGAAVLQIEDQRPREARRSNAEDVRPSARPTERSRERPAKPQRTKRRGKAKPSTRGRAVKEVDDARVRELWPSPTPMDAVLAELALSYPTLKKAVDRLNLGDRKAAQAKAQRKATRATAKTTAAKPAAEKKPQPAAPTTANAQPAAATDDAYFNSAVDALNRSGQVVKKSGEHWFMNQELVNKRQIIGRAQRRKLIEVRPDVE